jgi:hypothetical protein
MMHAQKNSKSQSRLTCLFLVEFSEAADVESQVAPRQQVHH